MAPRQIPGYAGRILRVDLTKGTTGFEEPDDSLLKEYIGGAALGIRYIFDEVPPGVEWSDAENRFFVGTGPLNGTRIAGSGSISIASKGPMTNGMTSTQANGFFGAYLKFCGFDGIIVQGQSPRWVYLYIHEGQAEIRDASHLVGKDTVETGEIIREDLRKEKRGVSVLCIGQAGENLVRFACPVVDHGHVASHNGTGAVMGSKRLKAIVVERGSLPFALEDKETISQLAKEILERILSNPMSAGTYREGTVGGVIMGTKGGMIPVKNYTTSIHAISPEKLETYTTQSVRSAFKAKPDPCWACAARHCHIFEVSDGKYAGRIMEEPEYEGMAAFSALVGIDDAKMTVILANEADRLGIDVNETGWVMAFLMECFEKRILGEKDTDGLQMTWGNSEAIMTVLHKIAMREGIGSILAEGVMRAAQKIGGEAVKLAVHTQKGNTPRGHDHRVMRFEQFDTSVSNVSTIEAHSQAPFKILGMPEVYDAFDPEVLPVVLAKVKGAMIFEDSLVTCRFQTGCHVDLLCRAVNAATGWNIGIQDAMAVGKRAVNLARVFNLRHGIDPELDRPSLRYGSTPLDGMAAGKGVMPQWDRMLSTYYRSMGWDEKTGRPLPQTLEDLGLGFAVSYV